MKSNFDQCLDWLLEHEGGFVNHPDDPGGMTNHGVTTKVYQEWLSEAKDTEVEVNEDLIRNIPIEHVRVIYRDNYWMRVAGDQMPSGLDWSLFDWAVNSGVGRAARALQKILGVTADGSIGPQTLAAVERMNDPEYLFLNIYNRRQAFYERLKTFETFGRGWSRRNTKTLEQSMMLFRGDIYG